MTESETKVEEQVDQGYDPMVEKLQGYGVDPKLVASWKQQYGRIGMITIQKRAYIFRGMKRLEWKQLIDQAQKAMESASPGAGMAQTEMAVSRCVLWPANFGSVLPHTDAGVVDTLSNYIMRFSGFEADEPEAIEL